MHVFLSPHLDDAVLSCGGTIHRLTERGGAVTILTVMAGDPPNPLLDTPIVRDLHRRWDVGTNPVAVRRMEDLAAAQVLGAQALHRDFPDCVYRTREGVPLYVSEESLFGTVHPDDALPDQLAVEAAMFRFLFVEAAALYVPLGVGHHVDHQIVRDFGLEIRRHAPTLAVKFYAEYPYTRDHAAIGRAFDALPDELIAQPQTVNAADMRAKIRAIACHRSQISTFWPDQAAMEQEVYTAFANEDGSYHEQFWTLEKKPEGKL